MRALLVSTVALSMTPLSADAQIRGTTTTRWSQSGVGVEANDDLLEPWTDGFERTLSISANGNVLAFISRATNLQDGFDASNVREDGDQYDLFVRDICAGTTTCITQYNGEALGGVRELDLSDNGQWVVFTAERDWNATSYGPIDLSSNPRFIQLYTYNLADPDPATALKCVSADTLGVPGTSLPDPTLYYSPSITSSGNRVCASIVRNAHTAPGLGAICTRELINGASNGPFQLRTLQEGTGNPATINHSQIPWGPVISPNGAYIAFVADEGGITGSGSSYSQVYRLAVTTPPANSYDRVSVTPGGQIGSNDSGSHSSEQYGSFSGAVDISTTGNMVVFTSLAKDLVNPPANVIDGTRIVYRRQFASTGNVTLAASTRTNATFLTSLGRSRPTVSSGGTVSFSAFDVFTGAPGTEPAADTDYDVFSRSFGVNGNLGRVSVTSVETEPLSPGGPGSSEICVISADGAHYAFVSDANNLTAAPDNNSRNDVFQRGTFWICAN